MKQVLARFHIWWLKARARSVYLRMMDKSERLDCGYALALEINSSLARDEDRVQRLVARAKAVARDAGL